MFWLLAESCAICFSADNHNINMGEQMTLRGTLKGHSGSVTQIATSVDFPDMVLSASRGNIHILILVVHMHLVVSQGITMCPPSQSISMMIQSVVESGKIIQ